MIQIITQKKLTFKSHEKEFLDKPILGLGEAKEIRTVEEGNAEVGVDQIIHCLDDLHLDRAKKATKIQGLVRGWLFRKHRLPLIFYLLQKFLKDELELEVRDAKIDGRVKSSMDEDHVSDLLVAKFGESRIWKPPVKKRMWYDIGVNTNGFGCKGLGWMPCNIKITTTKTADNTGSLAMCAWAYTDIEMNIKMNYQGTTDLARTFVSKLQNGEYNQSNRDYFFLVVNKDDPTNIIINSVLGLSILTSNSHNLPYQVKWSTNSKYSQKTPAEAADLCLSAIGETKPTWQESLKEFARNR